MIAPRDFMFCDIPFKHGGRTREGADCVGLVLLFLQSEFEGFKLEIPEGKPDGTLEEALKGCEFTLQSELERGDVIFFRGGKRGPKINHVAVWLGDGRMLTTVWPFASRIENGFTLIERAGVRACARVKPQDVGRLLPYMEKVGVVDWVAIAVGLAISLALSGLAYALTPKPKLGRIGNTRGRYSADALVTQNSPEIPLPDLLGKVVVAGNAIYTQVQNKGATISDATQTRANKVVILASAPSELIDYQTGLQINGLAWNDTYFKNTSAADGYFANPAQTKAEAVSGSIGSSTYVPSFTVYDGAHAITVPVDVRAQYDRDFPIYGFSGCSYLAFRIINSTKYSQFNVTCRVKCRKCRTFNSSGFIVTSVVAEPRTGDGTSVRFKLAYDDIIAVSQITIGGIGKTELADASLTGTASGDYVVNKTKGYIEFLTAPAAAAAILVTYTYHPRAWTQNPASQIVYLLTEKVRGKGFGESRIDWAAAVAMRDHADEDVTWRGADKTVTEDRFQTNYAVDFRKPIQEHLRALLDASYAELFLSNGKFVLKARTASASVFSFTEANIIEDSFVSELMDRADRANRVKVLFHSEESLNAETSVMADDLADQRIRSDRAGNNGVVDENLKFPAVTSVSQAERLAEMHLREEVGARWLVELTTSTKGLALQPGDVVDVTHGSQPDWAEKLFRVEQISDDEDGRLKLRLGDYVAEIFI